MQADHFHLSSLDNHRIFVRRWRSDASTPPRAIIHILHGMAEHSQRYAPLAAHLVDQGYVVFAHDHRGHGYSIPAGGLLGHFADHDGWHRVVADAHKVNEYLRHEYPGVPIVMIGHSMGSFITQSYLLRYGKTVDAVVLSGSAMSNRMGVRSARMLAHLEKLRSGPKGRSPLIDRATFGQYNRQITRQPRTGADWLSRDPAEVDKYVDDPLCGFLCTNQLWLDLTDGLEQIVNLRHAHALHPDIPFLLLSGKSDPLSDDPRQHGIERLAEHWRNAGLHHVDLKLYPNARHEIFNETNRQEVFEDLLNWLNDRFPAREKRTAENAAIA